MLISPAILRPSSFEIDNSPLILPLIERKSTLPEIFSNFPFKGVLLNNSFEIANSAISNEPRIFSSFSR